MSMVIFLQLITALLLVILGSSVWLQNRNKLRFGLLLFTLLLSFWIAFGLIANIPNAYALYFNRAIFLFPPLTIFAAAYMISQLTQTSPWLWRTTLYTALAMGAYALLTDQVVQAIVPRYNDALLGGYNITRGPSYLGYILMLCAMGIAVLSHIYVRRRKAKGLLRDQLSVIGSGFLLTLFVGLVLAAIIPSVTGSTEASEYSFLAGLISVGSFTFAIIRHGLFDVKLAAIRTAGYALTLATLSLVYFMLAYLASVTIFKENLATGFSMSPVNIGLALVLAFIFQPIKRFFDKTTDRIFYRDKYDTDEFIARLSEVLTTTTDLRNLLQRAAVEIGSTLKSEQAFFYVEYAETKHVSAGTTRHSTLSTEGFTELKKLIQSDNTDIFVTSLYNHTDPIYRLLTDKSIAILMPLRRGRTIMGYLALGEQRGSGYNNRDIKVLSTISDELLIAIQNSLSAQEVREINTHLQERIKAATEELQRSNDQLKKLDKSKDEFISMASHQLRTPLTAVKGYISMILDGDIGDISKEQRQVLEQAFDSSQRMVFLIGDFLNVSRIQTGKFMLELTEVNLTAMLPEEIEQLIDTAKRRKLNIHYEMSQALPAIIADENKLRQVMMNFMDNAIYYSKEGTTIQVRLYKDGNDIVFKVIDTGIGVPKAEQPHLFTKFYRASNARQRRPDGTGIGLYMAKKVIVAHGGAIIFETKESVGSTFGFRLPLKNKLEKLK